MLMSEYQPLLQNRFQIQKMLRQRDWALDYLGVDNKTQKPILITKVQPFLIANRPEVKIRFLRELEHLSSLKINFFLPFIAFFEEEKDLFLISDYQEGKLLSKKLLLNKTPPKWEEASSLMLSLCQSLFAMHAKGVVYRNLTPQSFLFNKNNLISLTDFGFYALNPWGYFFDQRVFSSAFYYLAPEQTGILKRGIDARCDIYSLGCIFYEILTGTPPFVEKDFIKLFHCHLAQTPKKLSKINPSLPLELENILSKMLAKEPSHRFSSIDEVILALENVDSKKGVLSISSDPISREEMAFQTLMAGREKEMDLLTQIYQKNHPATSLAVIYGMTGIGKTKLIESFHEKIFSLNPVFVSFKPTPPLKNTPYLAVEECLKQILESHFNPQTNPKTLSDFTSHWEILCAIFPNMLRFLKPHFQLDSKTSVIKPQKKEILAYLAEVFYWISKTLKQKIVFFIDDSQWIDNESLEFFLYFSAKAESASQFLLIMGLTQYQNFSSEILEHVSQSVENFEQISLQPLEKEQISLLVHRILNTKRDLGAKFYTKILDLSMGIPLWVQEILKELYKEEILYQEAYQWKVNEKGLEDFPFNPSLEKLVLKRFSNFSQSEQEVLSMASVLGGRFYLKDLHEVFLSHKGFEDLSLVVLTLEKGKKENFLEEDFTSGETTYFFLHETMEKTIYQKLSEEEKKELHGICAEIFEQKKQIKNDIYTITYHYNHSGQKKKLVHYNLLAYQQAHQQHSLNEAAFYLKNVVDFYLKNKVSSAPMRDSGLQLALILQSLGRIEESFNYLKPLQEISIKENLNNFLIKILLQFGTGYYYLNDTFTALSYYDQAIKLAEKQGHEITDSHPFALIGSLYYFQYNLPKAEHYLSLAARYLNPQDFSIAIRTYGVRAWGRVMAGEITPCFEDVQKIEALLNQVDNPSLVSQIYHYGSICYSWGNKDFEKALEYANLAMEYAIKAEDLIYQYAAYSSKSIALGFLGKHEESIKTVEEGIAFSQKNKIAIGISILYSYEVNLLIWKKEFYLAYEKAKVFLKDKNQISEKMAWLIFLKAKVIFLFLEEKTVQCLKTLEEGIEIYNETQLLLVGYFFLKFKKYLLDLKEDFKGAKKIQKQIDDIFQQKPQALFLEESALLLIGFLEDAKEKNKETNTLKGTKEKIQLESILSVGQHLSLITEKNKLFQFILEKSKEATGADYGLLILENQDGSLSFETGSSLTLSKKDQEIFMLMAKKTKNHLKGLLLEEMIHLKNTEINQWINQRGVQSLLLTPLPSGSSTIGMLYLESRGLEGLFSEKDLEVLKVFTIQAAFFIQNQRLKEKPAPSAPTYKPVKDKEALYNQYSITKREREIIDMVILGLSNKEISQKIFVSLVTVKMHIYNIFEKTGVKNRVELVNLFASRA